MAGAFLFDTHALIFWSDRVGVSEEFVDFFDGQALKGNLFVSSISFWEAALLVKKGRLSISSVNKWKEELCNRSRIQLIHPSVREMVESVSLPDFHKDPFDRLLISQANRRGMRLVTKDRSIEKYDVPVFWI